VQAADAARTAVSVGGPPSWLKKGLQVCKGKCDGTNSGMITVVGLSGWARPWEIVWRSGEIERVATASNDGWKNIVKQVPDQYLAATPENIAARKKDNYVGNDKWDSKKRAPQGMRKVWFEGKQYFAPPVVRSSVKAGSYTYNPGAIKDFAEKCFQGVGHACKQTGACTVYCMAKPMSVLKKSTGTKAECEAVCQGAGSPCDAAFKAFEADYVQAAATAKFAPDSAKNEEEADVEFRKQQFVSKGLLRKRRDSSTYPLMALMADQAAACHYEKLFKRQAIGSTGSWCIDAKTPEWQNNILPEFKIKKGLRKDAPIPEDTWQHGDNCDKFL